MLQWLWKSMISKTEIKMLRSLEKKKGRELYKLILVEGKRLIKQLIESEVVFNKIWATEDFIYKNRDLIKLINSTIEINSISKQDLKKITSTHNPSGIIGVLKPPKGDFKKMNNRIIMLDNIADPGNLGTILRTANWFGMNNILLSDECVDLHNPKVVRSAMGAHFKMNIISDKVDQCIQKLQSNNFQIIAADLNTNHSIENFKLHTNKWVLVMGSEAHGLSESVSKLVKHKIKIPQIGQIESLNVSVACGIFLYHISTIK